MPQRTSTKDDPFPSAPQATAAVMSPGGPMLVAPVKKAPAKKIPAKKAVAPVKKGVAKKGVMPLLKKKQALAVGVLRPALRGKKTVARIATATKRLAGPTAARTVINKGNKKIVRTAGKTKIIGPRRVITVTKTGSKIVNKKTGDVTRARTLASGKKVLTKNFGARTATKADDAKGKRVWGHKRSAMTYTKGNRSVTMARRAGTPNKVRVHITGPKGTRHKIIGPKNTKIIGPGGKSKVVKTRYISQKRRQNVTPKVGQPGFPRGNTKPVKKTPAKTPAPTTKPAAKAVAKQYGRGDWAKVRGFRRRRLKRGARYNQSLTKSQLRAIASRRLS